jgi:putative ABC transport system permease protein
MLQDLRLAIRRVLRSRGFSISVVLILGTGLGTVAAMANVLYALAYRPVSIPHPETLVAVSSIDRQGATRTTPLAAVDHLRRSQLPADGWCAFATTLDAIESQGRMVESNGELLSTDCLSVLQLTLPMGRWFTPEEAPHAGPGGPVMVITHELWRRLFDEAPDVLGRSVKIQNISATVIGVMPRDYRGFSQDLHPEFILPFNAHRASSGGLVFIGRLREGQSVEELRSQVRAMWPSVLEDVLPASPTRAQTLAEYSGNAESFAYGLSTMRRLYAPTVTRLTWLAAALFALVCINVGGLTVSRIASRSIELATMRALGAKPLRVMRPLAAECAILAVASISLGVPIAFAAASGFAALLPIGNLPWDLSTRPDIGVLLVVVITCVIAAILVGAAPALTAARGATQLRSNRTVSRATSRWAQALLVAQVAATVVLVFAGGLLFRSFSNLQSVDRGYVKERLLSLRLSANPAGYRDLDPVTYYPALVGRVAALPGVQSVALARYFGTINARPFNLPVSLAGSSETATTGMLEFISPGFFATAGVPLLQGRDVAWTDTPDTPTVAVVSDSFARALSPDADVIGRVIKHGSLPATSRLQIVGIVGNLSFGNFRDTNVRAIYVPAIQQRETAFATVHVRITGAPMAFASQVSEAIAAMGREHVRGAYAEDVLFTNSIVSERMGVMVSGVAAALALIISCIGLFALMSHTVHRRTREIGIRLAVGASPASVSSLIIGQAMRITLIGLAMGLPLAVASASFLSSLLFGIAVADAATLAGSAALLIGAAAIGAAHPAWRAVRVDPATALRAEE